MIARAIRAQNPCSTSGPARCGTGNLRRRNQSAACRRFAPRRPYTERRAGCSVAAAAIETSGIRNPPTPIERMNGTGMKSRRPSPIATVAPEKITARPAVAMVLRIASSFEPPRSSSSRKR